MDDILNNQTYSFIRPRAINNAGDIIGVAEASASFEQIAFYWNEQDGLVPFESMLTDPTWTTTPLQCQPPGFDVPGNYSFLPSVDAGLLSPDSALGLSVAGSTTLISGLPPLAGISTLTGGVVAVMGLRPAGGGVLPGMGIGGVAAPGPAVLAGAGAVSSSSTS